MTSVEYIASFVTAFVLGWAWSFMIVTWHKFTETMTT